MFFGKGNGSFTEQSIFSTGYGSFPISIAVNDLNNDTQLDIVVVNHGSDNIGIFHGNVDGTFGKQITYSTGFGSRPLSVAIGDFDKDSHLDITVANNGTANVGIFLGNGDGRFQKIQVYATEISSSPTTVVVCNINNDIWIDIIIAIDNIDNIGILLGDGPKSFTNQTIYSTGGGSSPLSLAVGDFNNDTLLDIVVAAAGQHYVEILFGNSKDIFSSPITYPTDNNPRSIAVGDFNNDGKVDIVVANSLTI